MYAVLKGEDFLVIEHVEKRRAGEDYLEDQIKWYNLAYSSVPVINEVMTNKEFWLKFPEKENCVRYRRLGAKLTQLTERH